MNYFVNKHIKGTERIYPMQGRRNYLRYDMNENPEGLPDDFVEMVKKEINSEFLAVYPEQGSFIRKYAAYINKLPHNVMVANGSDMAIRYILETFGEAGKEVLTVSPSFEMYRVHCSILGYNCVQVEYNSDFSISLDKILSHINDNTRVVVLVNPNNPVGNVYNDKEIEAIVSKAKQVGAVVIIDEAYYYFYNKSSIVLIEEYDNLIVLRTFSKLFSLAACRLGIIISSEGIINNIKKSALSFDVNAIALLFGERLLEHPEIEMNLIKAEKEGKKYILNELEKHGYTYRTGCGNFIFIKPRKSVEILTKDLKQKHKVLVKSYACELLRPYIRVTTGSINAMKKFLAAFFETDER